MKKAISILIILISNLSIAQHLLPLEGTHWKEVKCNYSTSLYTGQYFVDHIRIEGDTIINGMQYKKLFVREELYKHASLTTQFVDSLVSFNDQFFGGIREDSQKIYVSSIFYDISMNEKLMYDFSAQVGDTVEVWHDFFDGSVVIDSINSIIVSDGSSRNKFVLKSTFGDPLPVFWIEGIGSNYGLLAMYLLYTTDESKTLRCLTRNDVIIYDFLPVQYDHCLIYPIQDCESFILGTTQAEKQLEVTIYPNPMSEYAILKFNNFLDVMTNIDIYDIQGVRINTTHNITNNEVIINRENLSSGLYFVHLYSCYADTVVKVSSSVQFTTTTSISQSNQARIDGNGQVQIADGQVGLVVDNTSYFPNGPRYQNAFRINYNNDRITVLSGGYSINGTAKNSTEGYFDYSDLQWTNFQSEFPTVTDLVSSAHNSTTNLSYYASYGDGLLMRNGTSYTLFNSSNGPLNQASSGKVYVTDIQIDEAGNTWLTNYTPNPSDFQKSLFKIDTDGQWTGYEISHSTGRSALSFVIDKDDVKWMVVKQGSTNSILAYNPETGHRKQLTKSLSALPGSVNCLDTDKKGNIYIGTDNGLAQISNPSSVFTANPFTVYVPILGNQQLLKGKHIHAIKIDGGGRLWVGTNNGLFLFNEELSEQIALFTTKNSPLLSNKITAIEIDGETGEVFVSTIEGIFSYMGFATEATDKNKDEIVIFPNPVRPNYHGYVAIRGLVSDANVKITDINTNLVHETNAEGGTATWDMRLLSGERATTGVYLVFTSDEEGEETFVGKIAVISE